MKNGDRKNRLFKLLVLITFAGFLFSCFGVKSGTSKGGKSLYETFFVGDQGIQYFIKPLEFKNEKGKMLMDLTFRHKDKTTDSVVVNLTVHADIAFKNPDSLVISKNTIRAVAKNIGLIFTERQGKKIATRISAKYLLNDINKLFASDFTTLVLYANGNTMECKSVKSTQKKIQKINFQVFSLF